MRFNEKIEELIEKIHDPNEMDLFEN